LTGEGSTGPFLKPFDVTTRKTLPMPERFVPFAVTVCGIPELSSFGAAGVTHVLSILDPDTPEPSAFGQYGEHQRLELHFDDIIVPRPGMEMPQRAHVERILEFGRDLVNEPEGVGHLLVHCHAGISRSTASLVMILAQARPDRPAREAVEAVAAIRPQAWPNILMTEMADDLLGRGGELVDAVRERHHAYGTANPAFAADIINWGRGREVFWLDEKQKARASFGLLHLGGGNR
jgi:predicted protein tyrosine phosphatase